MPIAIVVGTRPEAIKMAPVHAAIAAESGFKPLLVSTGQHTDLLRSALEPFGLKPEVDLQVMTEGQSLAETAAKILDRFSKWLAEVRPKAVLVQGDTTTAFAAGLAAYYARIPVGHVEAGLRTFDLDNPFPEESNRQLLGRIARWHFPPTDASKQHLLAEGIAADRIHVVGNTGIDALLSMVKSAASAPSNVVLMTLHRRESFGEPLREVLAAIGDFLDSTPDAVLIWPVHPNPSVQAVASEFAAQRAGVRCVAPMGYREFCRAMVSCRFMITDSGGVQEEAPSLGKRVLIARDTTERPEAVASGQNWLVGRTRRTIVDALHRAWGEAPYSGPFPAPNPYGDGQSSKRIATILARELLVR